MKRKLAIVILLAVLTLLSIPTVAVFLLKTTSIESLAVLPCDNCAIHAHHAPKESERRLEHDTGAETDTEGSERAHTRRRISSPRRPRRRPDRPRPIMTRGGPCEYRHIGILTVDGAEGPVSLFGRPTYRGSDRWNYYALSNQHVPQKLPVFCSSGANGANGPSGQAGPMGSSGQLDCAKLKGCPEASDGDTLDVRGYGRASVTLYARDEYF